jgi:hypothetical protein
LEAAEAISLVSDLVRSRGMDYPSEGLEAVPFEAGWRVYAPVDIDESTPMAFLSMPVDRSVFLVGHSGRIEETSTSIPPRRAHERFIAQEATGMGADGVGESEQPPRELSEDVPPTVSGPAMVGAPPEADTGGQHTLNLNNENPIAAEATRMLDPIAKQLAQLGPPGWERFSAVFAFTISAEVAQLRFGFGDQTGLVPVPVSIAQLVRQQREVAAAMPAGPWWRLLLSATNGGQLSADYDYGDEPFSDDQLLASEHYRNDIDAYPRDRIPVWLAGYIAGPAAQGRDPRQAAVAAAADIDAGRSATATEALPALPDLWARWAALSAASVGVESQWGPRIFPGYAWYESDRRSGSTLYLLPGERAVLSGGKWNSALLEAAYNGGQPLPDLYTGAPPWVNDTVLNGRIGNGLLSFCFWSTAGRWYRGTADTVGDLDEPLPPVWTADAAVQAMISQTGPGTEEQCRNLLTACITHNATNEDVAAIFINHPDADVPAAINQLSLAGVVAL